MKHPAKRPIITGPLIKPAGEHVARPLRIVALQPWRAPKTDGSANWSLEEFKPELQHIATAGFDAIRSYEPLPLEILDYCSQLGLGVFAGFSWDWFKPTCLDEIKLWRKNALAHMRPFVLASKNHPALWCWIVGNELPVDVVRRIGWRQAQILLEEMVDFIHQLAPQTWAAYASFPPTLPLQPRNADISLFNLYLEEEEKLQNYLPLLQTWSGGKPVLLGEFGLDARSHGEQKQARLLSASWQQICAHGLAGWTAFCWSDRWWSAGADLSCWQFGLTETPNKPRLALASLCATWNAPPKKRNLPAVSVLICTYQGSQRISATLEALSQQNFRNFELLIISDGKDPQLETYLQAKAKLDYTNQGFLREDIPLSLIQQPHAGLSAARNKGASKANGEILVYLDDDSEPHSEWLSRLILGMETFQWDAAGGPVSAPERYTTHLSKKLCRIASAPGQAQPVLLGNGKAEHIPGCSFAVRKHALEWIGGWDPQFTKAGDDVDFCWRLEQASLSLGFVADALMWHRPRNSWLGYFRQQIGYGKAEYLLAQKWPEKLARRGQFKWQGAVYSPNGRETNFNLSHEDFPVIYNQKNGIHNNSSLKKNLVLCKLQLWARRLGYFLGKRKSKTTTSRSTYFPK